jgi:hypothetical protein
MKSKGIKKNINNYNSFKVIIISLVFLMAILCTLSTIAIFTFSISSTGNVLTFGNVSITAKVDSSDSFSFTNDNLLAGATSQKTLTIKNNGNINCYIRVHGEFFIGNDQNNLTESSLMVINIDSVAVPTGDNMWVKDSSGDSPYYYYNMPISPSANDIDLTVVLTFNTSNDMGNSQGGMFYKMNVIVDGCQQLSSFKSGKDFDYSSWVNNE